MAYDEKLAESIRDEIGPRTDVAEIKMFGGLCFLAGALLVLPRSDNSSQGGDARQALSP